MNLTKIQKKLFSGIPIFPKWLLSFLPLAFVITTTSGLIYVVVHQNIRQSANDPQIQISEDIATSLGEGQDPSQIIPNYSIDISKTLSNFVIVYDEDGKVIVSTASLDEKAPEVPKGVLDFAKAHGQNKLTWMPRKDVRTAIVVTHYSNKASGFVLVGRSLREIEKRVDMLTKEIALAWAVTLIGALLITIFLEKLTPAKKK